MVALPYHTSSQKNLKHTAWYRFDERSVVENKAHASFLPLVYLF